MIGTIALRIHRSWEIWADISRQISRAADFDVAVYDLDRAAADAVVAAGAAWAGSVPELAQILRCADHLPALARSASAAVMNQALPRMRAGSTWIEMSTNDFAEVEALAARALSSGVATLACPVTGGVHRAEAGEITVLVGGAQQVFEAHEPALKAMGGRRSFTWAASSRQRSPRSSPTCWRSFI